MAEDNIGKVLEVYKHFGTQAGEALISAHFLGLGQLRRWSVDDLQDGIDEARKNGLIEGAERGWRLTEAGFLEAAKHR